MPKGSPAPINLDEYMTLIEAAAKVGVTKQSLSGARKTGQIQGIRVGRTVLFHKQEVLRYQKTRRRGRPKKSVAQ